MAQSRLPARSQTRPCRGPRVRCTDDNSESPGSTQIKTPIRPSRSVRRIKTYRESSDESEDQSCPDDTDASSEEVVLSRGTKSRPSRPEECVTTTQPKRRAQPRATSATATSFSSFKRRKFRALDTPSKSVSLEPVVPSFLSSKQRVPPWQQLPYHILVSIMKYAAYPLYGQASRSNPSINWLCSTSLLCRSFHEACIAALLYSPPLYPASRAHGLMRLLREGSATLATNYKRKINYLDIEVKQLLYKKSGIPIDELLSHTPLLQGIRLYSNHDDFSTLIWAQPTADRLNWSYPDGLFDCLDRDARMMKSFEWNGRFPTALGALGTAMRVHSNTSFRRLRHLAFLNLTLPERASGLDTAKAHSLLGGALKDLSELKSLSFRNCTILDKVAASMLPVGLQELEFSHCSRLTSGALEQYLQSGGSSLRTLKLFGNQSMSLGFMARLRDFCPRLQVFEVDMLYIDPTSYRDRDPLYDELLPNGPPTWPVDLITVSVENLRQLSVADAEDFFSSLVESSAHLPYLRTLNIKAILKGASWRDRAQLRQTWLPKLEAVFLSSAEPSNVTKKLSRSMPAPSYRHSSRIANSHLKTMGSEIHAGENGTTTPPMVQPRCEVVNLVISDQRPSQDQFHEEDFLDDEPSDDEEWNGRDTDTLPTGYAW